MIRSCGSCEVDISHKRKEAKFCSRNCKMAHWHKVNRATEEGRAAEAERNKARYAAEAEHRRASAIAYYERNREAYVERSRSYRKEHPERRCEANGRRHRRMVENPGFVPFGANEWRKLVNLHRGACAYCGETGSELVKDHVVPLARGGRHAIANILPSCRACNARKSTMLLSEWRHKRERG